MKTFLKDISEMRSFLLLWLTQTISGLGSAMTAYALVSGRHSGLDYHSLDAVNRLNIPVEIQGRVYAARNSFQFFTIPVGYFLGGLLVDRVFEPLMALQRDGSLLISCFGAGKGSGAACFFAVLWLLGIGVCLWFRADREIWKLEQ